MTVTTPMAACVIDKCPDCGRLCVQWTLDPTKLALRQALRAMGQPLTDLERLVLAMAEGMVRMAIEGMPVHGSSSTLEMRVQDVTDAEADPAAVLPPACGLH